MVDGKTYYYLYDIDKRLIHVCSDGKTLCGKTTEALAELNLPSNVTIEKATEDVYKLCEACANYKPPKRKKATFKSKAEFTTPEKEG